VQGLRSGTSRSWFTYRRRGGARQFNGYPAELFLSMTITRPEHGRDKADALEAELKPLVGGRIVAKMFKYDTDPAHNPQPPRDGER
jgi:hypothetical protein